MNILRNFANLIKVKTIVTLIVIVIFAVLALRGDISPDNVMIIVTSVIAFYFGTQHEKHSLDGATTVEVHAENQEH